MEPEFFKRRKTPIERPSCVLDIGKETRKFCHEVRIFFKSNSTFIYKLLE